MTDTVLYEVRNISKSYGSVVALENVSLQVRAGEVLGLVGDNGAGKSTLVKALSGAHLPDSGEILASELTTMDDGDASLVGPLLDQIDRPSPL